MGSNCSKDTNDSSNLQDVCSDSTYDPNTTLDLNNTNYSYKIPNYCGDASACTKIGQGVGNGISLGFASSEDCCENSRVYCIRTNFPGDPKKCCTKSYNTNPIPSNCFAEDNNQQACDPQYRSIVGSPCQNLFTQTCINTPTTNDQFFAEWNGSNFCSETIKQNSTSLSLASQQKWANDQMNTLFQKYFTNDTILPGASAGSFQNYLYNFCLSNPQACQTALTNLCINTTNQDAKNNINIANFCGCHMNPTQTALYTNVYGIDPVCTGLCARPSTIPVTDSTGNVLKCQGNICIIDDVTISLANSTAGNITFGQICGGCENNTSCQCIISGVTVQAADSQLGNISLQQNCGKSVTCAKLDASGKAQPVDCTTGQPTGGSLPSPSPNPTPATDPVDENNFFIFGFIILAILILFCIGILFVLKK